VRVVAVRVVEAAQEHLEPLTQVVVVVVVVLVLVRPAAQA
jgi:hypothetical protein